MSYLPGGIIKFARKKFNTARSNTTTLADDPDLSFELNSKSWYAMDGLLIVRLVGGSDPDFKFAWDTPAGTNVDGILHYNPDGSTGSPVTPAESSVFDQTTVGVIRIDTATVVIPVHIMAVVEVNSLAESSITLQWAQNVSSANSTNLAPGSFLRLSWLGDTTGGG